MLLGALAAGCSATGPASNAALERSPAGMEQVPLTIHSKTGTHKFIVEVARTPEEQERGLMFRQSMAPNKGMIFPNQSPREASFWMNNTLITLDMVFIRANGTIARIEANTVPLSLDPVNSGEPVAAVLELAGGHTTELGIVADDKVEWPH